MLFEGGAYTHKGYFSPLFGYGQAFEVDELILLFEIKKLALKRIRTSGLPLRRRTLYPSELSGHGQGKMAVPG